MLAELLQNVEKLVLKIGVINLKRNNMKGVPHFKKDGTIYKGATHKDAKGKLMSGKTHTKSSVYVYHINELPKKSLMKAYKQAKLLK